MKVLIVDDDIGLSKVLTALCTSAGHEVVAALTDGSGLEEALAQLRPDILCLDYNLPGRDGLTILAAVHAQAPGLDVVFMTGSDEADIEQRAADAGASGFLRKPFSQQQVLDELRDVVDTRQHAASAANGAAASAPVRAEPAAGGQPGAAAQGCVAGTAVIADDSAAVRLVLKGLLEECGLRVVHSAGNGAEAINALRARRPAVLCLDVNMPVMGGLEALELARAISPETAVVMVTASADRVFVTQAATHGARGYILKPLRPAYVVGFMKKLMA